VTGKACHPERNARDLRKISPGVDPEPAEGIEMTIIFYLCAFASLREIFRLAVAVLPCWALRGELRIFVPI